MNTERADKSLRSTELRGSDFTENLADFEKKELERNTGTLDSPDWG